MNSLEITLLAALAAVAALAAGGGFSQDLGDARDFVGNGPAPAAVVGGAAGPGETSEGHRIGNDAGGSVEFPALDLRASKGEALGRFAALSDSLYAAGGHQARNSAISGQR
jgi:hypothetical protein